MKRKVLFVASLFLATATFAQDGLTSKKGEAFLPEAGDWAIGFDANPFLNYAGNMFSGSTSQNTLSGATWTNPNWAIYGKMFKDENTAYRAMVRIGFGSNTYKGITDTSTTTLTGEIEDKMKVSNFNLTFGGGIEKRRGSTRIQGIYGAEALISLSSSSATYTYADASSGTVAGGNLHFAQQYDFAGTDPNFMSNSNDPNLNAGERVTKDVRGGTFSFGVRAFIGVEWFIFPKVSVAAEYGWGLAISSTGNGEKDTEEYAISTGATDYSNIARKHVTGGRSSFGLDTDVSNASLKVLFHF